MPLYEFKCPKCGHEFDVIQKFSDDPPKCPAKLEDGTACDSEVEKKVSRNSFQLKGGGWFNDTYGK